MSINSSGQSDAAPADVADVGASSAGGGPAADDPRQKAAATVRRRKEERRAESLREIRAQTADGSLVVRHMSPAQLEEASVLSREILARNEARGKRYKSPGRPAA